jgi:hypothetical protein
MTSALIVFVVVVLVFVATAVRLRDSHAGWLVGRPGFPNDHRNQRS